MAVKVNFIIILLFQTIQCLTQPGVHFQHRGQLVFVASFHQVVVEIKMSPLLRELTIIELEARKLIDSTKEWEQPLSSRYLDSIVAQINDIRIRALDLQLSEQVLEPLKLNDEKTTSRSKRGLVNGIGTAASFLFGLATEDEIRETNKKVGQIMHSNTEIIQEVNKQTTVLHELSREMTSIGSQTNELKSLLSHLNSRTELVNLLEHVNWLRGTLTALDNKLNIINFGLQKMRSGRLAPELLSMRALNDILIKLQAQGSHLLFQKAEQIALYTDLSLVVPVPAGEKRAIRFIVLLPLKDMAYSFHLFDIMPLPVWNETLGMGIAYDPPHPYLAVSSDLSVFSPIRSLGECKTNGKNFLCPVNQAIFLREFAICEIALYVGSNLVEICPRKIYTTHNPSFTKTNTGYLYSIPSPLDITVQCSGVPPVMKTYTLQGVGELKLKGGCHASGRGVLLASPTDFNSSGEIFEFSPLSNLNISLLTEVEFHELNNHKYVAKQHLGRDPHNPLKLNPLLDRLREIKNLQRDEHWEKFRTPGSIIMSLVLTLIIFIILRLVWFQRTKLFRCLCWSKTRSATLPIATQDEVEETQELDVIIPPARQSTRPRLYNLRAGARS